MTGRRLQASERAALGELYPAMRRFAAVAGPLDVDPDELLAEALASTVRRHRLAPADVDRLRRSILRAASGHRHRLGRERRALARLHSTGEGVEPIYTDVAELLRLSPTVRALLFLVDIEEEDPIRVASGFGTTVDAVASTTDRARKALGDSIGAAEAIHRAFDRLADRGRSPDPESVMARAEARMAPTRQLPPPRRTRLSTRGWRRRRADFDRNVRSMAAGAAVAVFIVSAAVVGALILSTTGGGETSTATTLGSRASTTTTIGQPAPGRIVGWTGIGEVDPSTERVASTTAGFVAWGPRGVRWSPDGGAWEDVDGPAPGAIVAVAGATVLALDPPTGDEGALLWQSADGGATWNPIAGSASAIPRIPGVTITIDRLIAASAGDTIIAAAGVRGVIDWPALLEADPSVLSVGAVDGEPVVWLETEGGDREAHRVDAVASGSQITIRAVRISDGERVFELQGSGGVLSTAAASDVLVAGGRIGGAVWRSEDGGRFERTDDLPAPVDDALIAGGVRFTLITDGTTSSDAIWSTASGEDWEVVRDEPPFDDQILLGGARAVDDWVAVTTSETGVDFWASVDGRNWFRSDTGLTEGAQTAQVTSAASGWVAAITTAEGTSLYWSPNGADWAIQIVPTRDLRSAVAARSGVVAVDSAGTVWFGEIGG